jgi:hypothetical protein
VSIEALVPEVRAALAVSGSFEPKIKALITRSVTRLLRDYHFPKAVKRQDYPALAEDENSFALPAGFKKELEFRLFDPNSSTYSDPLVKRERFQLPYPSGAPHYYWLEGTNLLIDTPLNVSYAGFSGFLWYESMDAESNAAWLTADFADAVFYLSVVRGCAEFRKPEVMQTYAPLWQDEQTSLAIYLNELEWNNSQINMKEARGWPAERYPI